MSHPTHKTATKKYLDFVSHPSVSSSTQPWSILNHSSQQFLKGHRSYTYFVHGVLERDTSDI